MRRAILFQCVSLLQRVKFMYAYSRAMIIPMPHMYHIHDSRLNDIAMLAEYKGLEAPNSRVTIQDPIVYLEIVRAGSAYCDRAESPM